MRNNPVSGIASPGAIRHYPFVDRCWNLYGTLVIATLEAPSQAGTYKYFGSPEPFVANNKSYISFVLKPVYTTSSYVDAEVWVTDIESDRGKRFMLRCDDGADGIVRTDPESYNGANEVFIYYNQINPQGEFEIWRFATGIPRYR